MEFIRNQELNELFDTLADSVESSIEESENFNSYLCDVDSNKMNHAYKDSILLDINEYSSNPYFNLLKHINCTKGNISLTSKTQKKFTSFLYDDTVNSDNTGEEINYVGHFNQDFSYPVLFKNKTPWMSVVPHEINTMKQPINDAFGDVITFGCGLGYYAYMVSNKDNVDSVTIVDNDPNVIYIFKQFILPYFPNKEKIKVVNCDCFKFCQTITNKYDYLFVDTYHTPEDGLPFYVSLKPYINKIACASSFWIEKSIVTYFRRYLTFALIDLYSGTVSIDDFKNIGDDKLDQILAKFILSLKGKIIKNTEDLLELFDSAFILEHLK